MDNVIKTVLTLFYASPHYFLLALVAPLSFTWADRLWGADDTKRWAKVLLALTLVIMWFAGGMFTASAVLFWMVYRSLGFNYKGHRTSAPTTDSDRAATFRHHLLILPLMLVATLAQPIVVNAIATQTPPDLKAVGLSVLATVGVFTLYAKHATDLAIGYGKLALRAQAGDQAAYDSINAPGDKGYNAHVERQRGLSFGFAYVAWFAILMIIAVGYGALV